LFESRLDICRQHIGLYRRRRNTGAPSTTGVADRPNWNRILKMLFAMLIAGLTIGFAWVLGRDRHDHVVGASVEATELWRNPWPAPGARD
jgi:hypothetical protein